MRDMRSNAQIDHWPTSIHGGGRAVRYLGFDKILFILVVLRKLVRSGPKYENEEVYVEHLQ